MHTHRKLIAEILPVSESVVYKHGRIVHCKCAVYHSDGYGPQYLYKHLCPYKLEPDNDFLGCHIVYNANYNL